MTANETQKILLDVVPVEARSEVIGQHLGLLEAGTQNMRRELGDLDEETLMWH